MPGRAAQPISSLGAGGVAQAPALPPVPVVPAVAPPPVPVPAAPPRPAAPAVPVPPAPPRPAAPPVPAAPPRPAVPPPVPAALPPAPAVPAGRRRARRAARTGDAGRAGHAAGATRTAYRPSPRCPPRRSCRRSRSYRPFPCRRRATRRGLHARARTHASKPVEGPARQSREKGRGRDDACWEVLLSAGAMPGAVYVRSGCTVDHEITARYRGDSASSQAQREIQPRALAVAHLDLRGHPRAGPLRRSPARATAPRRVRRAGRRR